MSYSAEEVREAADRYVRTRHRIEAGDATWTDLAELFTADAVYVDPAWGRIEGLAEIRKFLDESMRGLDDWAFPIDFYAVEGDRVVVKWTQVLPGADAHGRPFTQSGFSMLVYGGGGKFVFEEDLLNMVHVLDDLRASGWTPPDELNMPPADPDRDFSRPS